MTCCVRCTHNARGGGTATPWVFISLVAAFVMLVATLMQTFYTVMPFCNNQYSGRVHGSGARSVWRKIVR
uniref:Uncharacterized protein n=1 Tax=Oryza nivara TaxID=4536 RepID=A0A0E0J2Q7_ORYNI